MLERIRIKVHYKYIGKEDKLYNKMRATKRHQSWKYI